MAESTFLAGKVTKQSLPALPVPVGAEAPRLKRLLLPQGELAQFHDGGEPIHYLAFLELGADSIRGNHYHKVKAEYLYLIHGEVLLLVEDIAVKSRESLPLRTGDLVHIQTGVAHALKILAPGQAIEFSKAPFNPADIYRWPLT
ncbi:MAG TPA: hypothetical protein VNT26_14115 [Candidatus Sulfotelmatobacter sp.]|nr:hypothetical protein [Candidatus Sulfotelmatobacter sp.]